MANYIVYSTPWSEGSVGVREDDNSFPVGYDPNNGVAYTKDLQEILRHAHVEIVTPNIEIAAELDSAGYARDGKDPKEVELYSHLVRDCWNRRSGGLMLIIIEF